MNVRIFWVRAMKCMCAQTRPRFILSSKRVFWGDGVWTHVNSKGKIPSTGKCPQRRIEPATLWTANPSTTNWAITAWRSAWRAADPGFGSRFLCGDFSRSSHTRDLEVDTPVATLPGAWCYSQCWDWLAWCQYNVTEWESKFNLQLLSHWDSMWQGLSREVPEIHWHVAGTLIDQKTSSHYRGFRTRMVYLNYIYQLSCLRYTIVVQNPRYDLPILLSHHDISCRLPLLVKMKGVTMFTIFIFMMFLSFTNLDGQVT